MSVHFDFIKINFMSERIVQYMTGLISQFVVCANEIDPIKSNSFLIKCQSKLKLRDYIKSDCFMTNSFLHCDENMSKAFCQGNVKYKKAQYFRLLLRFLLYENIFHFNSGVHRYTSVSQTRVGPLENLAKISPRWENTLVF